MTQEPLITLDALIRRLNSVPEREMRRFEIQRWVRFGDSDEVVGQLDDLLARCMRREPGAQSAELVFADFLLHVDDTDALALEALDMATQRQRLRGAAMLLSDHLPARQVEGALRNINIKKHVPAGVRRSQARRADRFMLEALLADPDPRVINRVCANPRVKEEDIVAVVAKRPNRSEVLDEVARSRWFTCEAVQRALVQNPYTRTNLAISLLPQMNLRFLAALRYALQVHQAVRDAAQFLLELVPGWSE